MKVNFDGLRKNLANQYNELAIIVRELSLIADSEWGCGKLKEQVNLMKEEMDKMRECVGFTLCIYDESVDGDMTMLADSVKLEPWFCKDGEEGK